MKSKTGTLRLSATDLSNHLACHHLTAVHLQVVRGERAEPDWRDPDLWVQQRGLAHEQAYLNFLAGTGLSIADLRGTEFGEEAFEQTLAAMSQDADVIAQATIISGSWMGRADVLPRTEKSSLAASATGHMRLTTASWRVKRERRRSCNCHSIRSCCVQLKVYYRNACMSLLPALT